MPHTFKGKSSTTYDFHDGNGPVPAHRHAFGFGWIANTATVSKEAYVGPFACVYDHAEVKDNATVCGLSRVSGNARIGGYACIKDRAQVLGLALIDDSAVVKGKAIVASTAQLHDHDECAKDIISAESSRCFNCPLLSAEFDNYSGAHESACMKCMSAQVWNMNGLWQEIRYIGPSMD